MAKTAAIGLLARTIVLGIVAFTRTMTNLRRRNYICVLTAVILGIVCSERIKTDRSTQEHDQIRDYRQDANSSCTCFQFALHENEYCSFLYTVSIKPIPINGGNEFVLKNIN